MNKLWSLFFLIFFSFSLQSVFAQQENLTEKVESYLKPFVVNKDFSGAVLISRNDDIKVIKGFGLASHELNVANSPTTVFHAASITKQFTAAAVLILEQRNKLQVQDPVAKYLPDFPNGRKITIHHLLSHRSGIPDYNELSGYDDMSKKQSSLEEVVDWFKNESLEFEPGAQYSYSNSNYVLLAYLIENISGSTYSDFLQKNIFGPLEMNNTGNFSRAEIIENRAQGYDPAPGGLRNAPWYDLSLKLGSGSIYTTVEDLYKWDRSLYGNKILTDVSKQKMYTDHGNNYGYGWGVYERNGNKFASHDGKSPGSFAYIKRYFDNQDVSIIFLSNINSGALNVLKDGLTNIVFGEDYKTFQVRETTSIRSENLNDYTGKYIFPEDFYFTIVKKEDGLYFRWMDTPFLQYLTPISKNKFIMRSRYDKLTFVKDAEGNVKHVVYDQGGEGTICPKTNK